MNRERVHCGEDFGPERSVAEILSGAEFEKCGFTGCDFSYADFSGVLFSECRFSRCRLTVPKTESTHMQGVLFEECRISGLDFGKCASLGFSVGFRSCRLDDCLFRKRKMPKTIFFRSELHDCFFSETDLSGASFEACMLPGTLFERCSLRGADFRTASDFSIDPAQNTIRKAKFSTYNLAGLLTAYGIEIE